MVEILEQRILCAVVIPPVSGDGFTPSQIRHAYGFDQVSGDGRGQTIAVVDAFRSPTIRADLKGFDKAFGLPDKLPTGGSVLQIASLSGSTKTDPTWALETALDVEWAQAIAPGAKILLVQAKSDSPADMFKAVNFARKQKGVSVVSMSWGYDTAPAGFDFKALFSTPANHRGATGKGDGVTFVEAAADNGATDAFPDSSINVVSVGGTDLTLNGSDYGSETRLAASVSPATVAFAASSFEVFHGGLWTTAGGTSASAPQWAGLFAIADEGRAALGKHSLDGATQTLQGLAALSADDFHIIVDATVATGRGSPFADRVIGDLIAL